MMPAVGPRCAVCGASDERALEVVVLTGGSRTTLCGSHALMHRRSKQEQASESDLLTSLRDRRDRQERRQDGDELASALTAAFAGERRNVDRRRA